MADQTVTPESREALSRAKLFLEKAKCCPASQRVDFEAFLEAAVSYGRTALLRVQAKHGKHPKWKVWWAGLKSNTSAEFIREERNWLLHETPPKIGQKVFVHFAGSEEDGGELQTGESTPELARDFYF